MSITSEALALQHQLDESLTRVTDQQVRDLVAAWVRAWDETAGDLSDAVDQLLADSQTGVVAKMLMVRNVALTSALDYIGRRLSTLASQAGVRIVGDIGTVVRTAAAAQSPIVGAMLPANYDLTGTVQASTLEAIITRSATQITSQTFPLGADAYDAMRRELLRGVVVGANPRHTADRIMRRAEMRFNGGLARALNIATTETLDAHRAGAGAGQAVHGDVLAGWVWLAHLTPATCRSCIAMNGTTHPLTEPGPLDHQHGRCARMPKTQSWRDLGINLDEPDDVGVPDSAAWFDSLSAEEQQKILGRNGYEAWARGDFPMEQWTKTRQNPGWRDSQVPAAPGDSSAGSGRGAPPNPRALGGPPPEPARGRVTLLPGRQTRQHEIDTAHRLADLGHHVEFVDDTMHPGDALIDGQLWEFKSPTGSGKSTVADIVRDGGKQSDRVVLDLARTPLPLAEVRDQVARAFRRYASPRVVWVLPTDGAPFTMERT